MHHSNKQELVNRTQFPATSDTYKIEQWRQRPCSRIQSLNYFKKHEPPALWERLRRPLLCHLPASIDMEEGQQKISTYALLVFISVPRDVMMSRDSAFPLDIVESGSLCVHQAMSDHDNQWLIVLLDQLRRLRPYSSRLRSHIHTVFLVS